MPLTQGLSQAYKDDCGCHVRRGEFREVPLPGGERVRVRGSAVERATLCRNPNRQMLIALDEAGVDALRLLDELDAVEALQDLLPDDLQLQLGEAEAYAAVDAEAEREMRARTLAVDDEIVRLVDHLLVA